MAHCGRWEGQLRDLPELQIQVRRSRRAGSVHRIWPTLDTAVTPTMNDASLNARHALFRTRRLIERIAKLYDLRIIPLARLRDFQLHPTLCGPIGVLEPEVCNVVLASDH